MEALIKEKKEKGNVLIDLELVNLRSVFLFYFEKFRKDKQNKTKKLVEANNEYQRNLQH